MAYTERANDIGVRNAPIATPAPIAEYHDTVRWGPILAGIVVSIVSQLMLSALGASIGGIAAGEAAAGTNWYQPRYLGRAQPVNFLVFGCVGDGFILWANEQ